MVDAYFEHCPTDNRVRRGNKMARERMSILYDFSAREHALILGTSNTDRAPDRLWNHPRRYGLRHQPDGRSLQDPGPPIGRYLKVPKCVRLKRPTAGLWAGQTDEDELGLTYAELDEILFHLVDERERREELLARGSKPRKSTGLRP